MNRVAGADTSPLYALADPSDQFHDRARRELENIPSRNNTLLVVFPVLCEAPTGASPAGRKFSGHPITLVDALLARMTRGLAAPAWTFDYKRARVIDSAHWRNLAQTRPKRSSPHPPAHPAAKYKTPPQHRVAPLPTCGPHTAPRCVCRSPNPARSPDTLPSVTA